MANEHHHASPTVSTPASHWPAVHAEVGILAVSAFVLAIGAWNERLGAGETLAILGILSAGGSIVSAWWVNATTRASR